MNIALDNVLALCFYISRPARQRGTSGGVWSWGGIARCEVRLKRPERARVVGRSEAPQGEELRSDAALSPGRHSPGELRIPRLPGSGTFQGVPPALAEASSVPSSRRVGPRGDALKVPTRGPKREARDQGAAERGVSGAGSARHLAPGPWPCHPRLTHRRWNPCRPGGPKPARRILRRGPVPAHPALAPLVFFRGSRTSRPSCLGPDQGREDEDSWLKSGLRRASRA